MDTVLAWINTHSSDLTNIVIYGAIAVVTLIGLFKCLLPLWGTTRALRRAIRKLQDEAGEKREVPVWQETRFMGRRLKGCWLRFLQNAEQLDRRGLPCNVEDYINDDTVTHGPGNATLAELIPSLLTSLGILGTFMGMTSGLSGLDPSTTEAMMSGINTLLTGMQFAFGTSVAGVSCSLVFNMLNRIAQGSSYRAIDDFVESFTQLAMQRPLDNDVQLICQNQDRNHLLTGVSEAMTSQVPAAIEGAVSRALNPISASMDRFLIGATRSQVEGVARIVDAFVLNLNAALDGQFLQLGETLNSVNQQQVLSNRQLQDAMQSTQQTLAAVQQVNTVSRDVLDRFQRYILELGDARQRDERFEADVSDLMQKLKESCGRQAELIASIRREQEEVDRTSQAYLKAAEGGAGKLSEAADGLGRSCERFADTLGRQLTDSVGDFDRSMREAVDRLTARLDALEKSGTPDAGDISSLQRLLTDIKAALEKDRKE